ncbi:MAG: putative SAM-dependent methyltransferase [Bacteroidia bacterium]|jgi:predicted SAM-dependent methyltransferase
MGGTQEQVESHLGGSFHCSSCSNDVKFFQPLPEYYIEESKKFEFLYEFGDFETLNLAAYSCPECGASDRDRLYALYFKKHCLEKWESGERSILDFAPSQANEKFFRSLGEVNYRTTDLMKHDVDDNGVNIENMTLYKEGQFDFLICSHVLEHVSNPTKAAQELHRVLKPGHTAIIMVPIMTTISETTEDPAHTTESERWKHYGQDDHVRMFSKQGFIDVLSSGGFEVNLLTESDFGSDVFAKHGIDSGSVLYTVKKY